jgi:hypothetical protein
MHHVRSYRPFVQIGLQASRILGGSLGSSQRCLFTAVRAWLRDLTSRSPRSSPRSTRRPQSGASICRSIAALPLRALRSQRLTLLLPGCINDRPPTPKRKWLVREGLPLVTLSADKLRAGALRVKRLWPAANSQLPSWPLPSHVERHLPPIPNDLLEIEPKRRKDRFSDRFDLLQHIVLAIERMLNVVDRFGAGSRDDVGD